jgi:hypothetical protein
MAELLDEKHKLSSKKCDYCVFNFQGHHASPISSSTLEQQQQLLLLLLLKSL